MKASAFRRWPVAGAYSPEQTTRLTGGSDWWRGKRKSGMGRLKDRGMEKDRSAG